MTPRSARRRLAPARGAGLAGGAGLHPAVGRQRPGPEGDADDRRSGRLRLARAAPALALAARPLAQRGHRGLGRAVGLGAVARRSPRSGAARAADRGAAGGGGAGGGEPCEEPQRHQLPLGLADLRRAGGAGVALALGYRRRRTGALLPRRPRVERAGLRGPGPAVALAAGGRPPARGGGRAVAGRDPAGGRGGRDRADAARRAPAEPHAVDAADQRRGGAGRLGGVAPLAGAFTSPGPSAAAGTRPCHRRWCQAPRAATRTTPRRRRWRTAGRPARW